MSEVKPITRTLIQVSSTYLVDKDVVINDVNVAGVSFQLPDAADLLRGESRTLKNIGTVTAGIAISRLNTIVPISANVVAGSVVNVVSDGASAWYVI
jgi:hypothetical protein